MKFVVKDRGAEQRSVVLVLICFHSLCSVITEKRHSEHQRHTLPIKWTHSIVFGSDIVWPSFQQLFFLFYCWRRSRVDRTIGKNCELCFLPKKRKRRLRRRRRSRWRRRRLLLTRHIIQRNRFHSQFIRFILPFPSFSLELFHWKSA